MGKERSARFRRESGKSGKRESVGEGRGGGGKREQKYEN